MGKRTNLNCGAFLNRDWCKALGVTPLGEDTSEKALAGNKFVSRAKIDSILPDSYKWTMPVKGVPPQSYYEPSGKVKKSTPANDDSQSQSTEASEAPTKNMSQSSNEAK